VSSNPNSRLQFGPPCVPQTVAAQAAATPDHVALVTGSQVMTYAEMNRRANQLAHHLRALGVGRDKVVGLLVERSPSMVVGALAILKAGGAYLPLDSAVPMERLAFMLREAGAEVVVTRSGMARTLPVGKWQVVDLDLSQQFDRYPVDDPRVELAPEDLAYVIFTSGSTGKPKGVEVTHGGLKNLVLWHCRAFQVTAADRASHQASLGFDAAVWEIWPYLAAGASLYIPSEEVRMQPEALRDWLVENGITITFLATALAESMLVLDWPAQTALRTLLTGADVLRRRPAAKLPFTLVNNYGPTECTVVATSGVVATAGTNPARPSIGCPIDNTLVYVLDEQMNPVAEGTPGELYIGGPSLARGYCSRPDLTEQKFVRNPFSSQPGSRLYRTGDLVRRLPAGEIEFLGRLDEQIKIRGYRVEPEEIVALLNAHPEVVNACVIDREDQAGEKRLVAYLVFVPGPTPSAGTFREHLRTQLPDYMIPAAFVRLETLPLAASGKLDRQALPSPDSTNLLRDEDFTGWQSIVEERLAAVIAPLLQVDRVGPHDNFFLMGGHSLLGTQLLAKISETFGVELTLLSLFDHPTLAEMSSEIEKLILQKIALQEETMPREFVPTPTGGTAR
jgi:amino acid adenylation domain-containing protein